ncbi:MAG: UDP-N-acetylglucosamine diphosphorylase [Ruminococcaceae bacterium]|nr:UDP-N-acetylglucosamine diphosphorylase [Oscillospiraceae bacterium]
MTQERLDIIEKHKQNGVIFQDPDSAFIDAEVTIGAGTRIAPNVHITGNTIIGKNVEIGFNTEIENAVIGDEVKIRQSVILESEIGAKTTVGPFAYVRPHCKVGEGVKLGDFVEIKNSNIGNGTKLSHLTYVGDADVGEKINFGCGTVVVNYDGKNKYRTVIEDHAFIGCNTNLVAPVTVGANAFTAAGSTITEDVPANTLAIARARQVVKTNWKRK